MHSHNTPLHGSLHASLQRPDHLHPRVYVHMCVCAGTDLAEQLRKLRLQVQQRDNEINILVGMLKRRDAAMGGAGSGGGGVPALISTGGGAGGLPSLMAPPSAAPPQPPAYTAAGATAGDRGAAGAGQQAVGGGVPPVSSSLAASPKAPGPFGHTQVRALAPFLRDWCLGVRCLGLRYLGVRCERSEL